MRLRKLFPLIFVVSTFIQPHTTLALGTITEVVPLSLGTIALKDNLAQYTLRITTTGSTINDSAFVIFSSGNPGEYFLSGFLPNTLINISVTTPTGFTELAGFTNPANAQFALTNFELATPLNTDTNGEKTIIIGATITTSGTGNYMDALYFSNIDVIVSY